MTTAHFAEPFRDVFRLVAQSLHGSALHGATRAV